MSENMAERKTLSPVPVSLSPIQQMISSSTGALVTSLFVTPLDVVKIRLQAQAKPANFTKGHCFLYCNGLMDHLCTCMEGPSASSQWYKRPNMQFTGPVDAAINIARHEGITSLWSGLPPTLIWIYNLLGLLSCVMASRKSSEFSHNSMENFPLVREFLVHRVMAIPATVVYFTSYEQLKSFLGFDSLNKSWSNQWKPMIAGITARTWAVTLISPLEMIRVKVQSENYSYRQVWTALKDTIRINGPLSMFRGLGPTLLRDVPFSGMYWVGYESIRSAILRAKDSTTPSFSESFISGAISGSIAAVATLPFDVIKTRCQIELGEANLMGRKPASTWTTIYKIYIHEGYRALFAGLWPRVFKIAPNCAIMISSFEYFKNFFQTRNRQKLAQQAALLK